VQIGYIDSNSFSGDLVMHNSLTPKNKNYFNNWALTLTGSFYGDVNIRNSSATIAVVTSDSVFIELMEDDYIVFYTQVLLATNGRFHCEPTV
jgi:hypothetical protein